MTSPAYLTLDAKRDLCSARVTLDGKPAKISGARSTDFDSVFGTVSDYDGRSFVWAWTVIASIVARGGEFRS